tara:strand:+ start:16094 stop:16954 length:861 start_codon:yes stop_codon:yes gene_type:complete
LNELIFVSSGGSKKGTLNFIEGCYKIGIYNIELSSGDLINIEGIIKSAEKKNLTIQAHNYFPPLENNYIINLAKPDLLNDKYFNKILNSQIIIANQFKRKFLHFHAGYCIDLRAKDLGSENLNLKITDRNECINNFYENVSYINSVIKRHGLSLLIENNVLNSALFNKFKQNPFLCCDPEETLEIFKNKNLDINLLLDLAHLKVSSNSMGFDFFKAVKLLAPITQAVHISDNDGKRDSNETFNEQSDVLHALKLLDDLNFITVEVYNDDLDVLKKQIDLVKKIRKN